MRLAFFPVLILPAVFLFSCSKGGSSNNGGSQQKKPVITSTSPSPVTTGSNLTIFGSNFGNDISKVTVYLNSSPIQIVSLFNGSLVVKIPDNLITSGTASFNLQLDVNGQPSNTVTITVKFEIHGWYKVNGTFSDGIKNMQFVNGDFGYATGYNLAWYISNGGMQWGNLLPGYGNGTGLSVLDSNNVWMERNYYDIYYSVNWSTGAFARLDTITSFPGFYHRVITGLWLRSSGNNGYMINDVGQIYHINGGFAPANLTMEYQSAYYTSNPPNYPFRMISGVDDQNIICSGYPVINSVATPVIIHKKNGVYSEYIVSNSSGYFLNLQLFPDGTAYFLNSNFEIYKLTGPNAWTKLSQRGWSMSFVNSTTGYADWNGAIWKTTDGGQSWTSVYTLPLPVEATVIYTKGEQVWAYAPSYASVGFLFRYNP